MLIGGGLAGLAGGVELLSQTHRVSTGLSQGFGYTAIIVAAITGMRPLGIFLVGSLFGALTIGGTVIQTMGVSSYIAHVLFRMPFTKYLPDLFQHLINLKLAFFTPELQEHLFYLL